MSRKRSTYRPRPLTAPMLINRGLVEGRDKVFNVDCNEKKVP